MSTFNNIKFQESAYQLNIKVLNQSQVFIDYYNSFSNHNEGDSGIDLLSNNSSIIEPFKVGTIDFNIQCEMIDLKTGQFVSYYLYPRSSISSTPFQMANSVGIIDAGYRGEIKAKVRNFNPQSSETLLSGRYFQITSSDLKPIRVNIVQELTTTSRGANGFGSTGV
jgi:dUTP pyrophosphatase